MGICSKCGEEHIKLLDIVSEEGIMKICRNCIQDSDLPIIKKPFEGAFEDTNTKKSVYERLSSVAGINPNKFKKFGEKDEEKDLQDAALKEIVDRNLGFCVAKKLDVNVDLIRNFHWVIMRARRLKKFTLSELAKKIAEPEEALKTIEKGDITKSNIELIKKLELFFGITLLTNESRKNTDSVSSKKVSFDKVISQSLTIDDLREMKKKEAPEVKKSLENYEDERDIESEKEELAPDEIDDLIFGRGS